jgi:hypothetical protein
MIEGTAHRACAACFSPAGVRMLGAAMLMAITTGGAALAGDIGGGALNAKAYQSATAQPAQKAAVAAPPMGEHGVARPDSKACKPIEDSRRALGGDPGVARPDSSACRPIEDARKALEGDPGGDGA